MSDKQNSGIVSLFATGLISTGAIIAPFILIWRYGVFWFLAAVAPIYTAVAIFQTSLIDAFPEENFWLLPWTKIAILTWATLIVTVLIQKCGSMPVWMRGRQ